MATISNTLYPPQVETFMPPFLYDEPAKIWFDISSYDEDKINLIKYIHISMVDQRNNINVFGQNTHPQYYPLKFTTDGSSNKIGYDSNKKKYWAVIPPKVIETDPYYNVGQYYKVQIRFDLTSDENPTDYFKLEGSKLTADALGLASYSNANQNNFSEWSVGTLLKPILIPSWKTINPLKAYTENSVKNTTDFQITGALQFNTADGDNADRKETECLYWYQIQVLNLGKTTIYYNSNQLYPENKNEINCRIDLSMLSVGTNYYIRIIYNTTSGYTQNTDFLIKIDNYENSTTCNNYIITPNEEEGTITLNMSGLSNSGDLIVRRASHYSNFTHWDLISARKLDNTGALVIKDNTVESMTGYRYQIQRIDGSTFYRPLLSDDIVHCDFYGPYFLDKDKMLRISFNFELSNRTNATNRTKTDTLGGQYPIFTQNSKLKYHTYSIAGRISSEDNGELFLPKEDVFGHEYYNYRYNPNAFSPHTSECQKVRSDNDWLYEREYRDAVEQWLNNGKPKLFKSMTEGNMIVILDSVSMTPDMVLGGRLYDFSATMYEIGDGKDLNSIISFGLYDLIDERQN